MEKFAPDLIWLLAIILQVFVIITCNRKAYSALHHSVGKVPALALMAPGTIVHEISHWAMCLLVRVKVLKVVLFWPRMNPDGSRTFGYVRHVRPQGRAAKLRSMLISMAPIIFMPPVIYLVVAALLGEWDLAAFAKDLFSKEKDVSEVAPWRWVLALLFSALVARGSFPSGGDFEITPQAKWALPLLIFLIVLPLWLILGVGVLQFLVLLLAPATFGALVMLYLSGADI